jgi:serine/threonine protein kinase
MEYVPGTSLRPLIHQKKLTANDAVAILKQVLAGLQYAHERGVVHRDVKPENILIHEDAARSGYQGQGMVKVTDFDLGKAVQKTIVGSIAYSQSMNDEQSKDIAGTLDYMAPEQRAGAEPTAKADLYACGVILYEMLTGEKPAGTDLPSDLKPGTPKKLDEAFKRSYARLEKRFESAAEFVKALDSTTPPPLPNAAQAHGSAVGVKGSTNGATVNRTACPNCRQRIDPSDQFCMHCGLQLVAKVRRCEQCGGYPDPHDRFCIFCGHTLAAESAAV